MLDRRSCIRCAKPQRRRVRSYFPSSSSSRRSVSTVQVGQPHPRKSLSPVRMAASRTIATRLLASRVGRARHSAQRCGLQSSVGISRRNLDGAHIDQAAYGLLQSLAATTIIREAAGADRRAATAPPRSSPSLGAPAQPPRPTSRGPLHLVLVALKRDVEADDLTVLAHGHRIRPREISRCVIPELPDSDALHARPSDCGHLVVTMWS